MKFQIDDKIFQQFPELNIGVIVVTGIDNKGENKDVSDLLKQVVKDIRTNYTPETVEENPKIIAWREAYKSFKAKPKNYKCSVENLYNMILEGVDLRHINKVVDIYNYISLEYMIPIGGDDLDKINGDIVLKYAKGDEKFTPLNSDETVNPKEGEIVYMDDKEVLCRRWNWRECDKSKMTEKTKNITLVIEGLPPTTKEEIEEVIQELSEMVKQYCGGDVRTFILDNKKKEIEI